MNIFKSYFFDRIKFIILLLVLLVINAINFLLTAENHAIFQNALLFSFTAVIIFFIFDYLKYRAQLKELFLIKRNLKALGFDLHHLSSKKDAYWFEILSELNADKNQQIQDLITDIENFKSITNMWIHQMKIPVSALYLLTEDIDFKQADELNNQLFHLNHYLDTLLNYLKLNDINLDFRFETVDVAKVFKSILPTYAPFFIDKNLSLEMDVSLSVTSDQKWLGFIFDQLISNAVKYSKENKKIKIYSSGNHLFIQDFGIGILAEDLPRIFSHGFTGYNGRKNKQSSGIGLFLVKKVCDQLGHSIKIQSEVNQGTTVIITFANINKDSFTITS